MLFCNKTTSEGSGLIVLISKLVLWSAHVAEATTTTLAIRNMSCHTCHATTDQTQIGDTVPAESGCWQADGACVLVGDSVHNIDVADTIQDSTSSGLFFHVALRNADG
jgi:hypothetical protein